MNLLGCPGRKLAGKLLESLALESSKAMGVTLVVIPEPGQGMKRNAAPVYDSPSS